MSELEPYVDDELVLLSNGKVRVRWLGSFVKPWFETLQRRYAQGEVVEILECTNNGLQVGMTITMVAKSDRGRNALQELSRL